MDDLILEGGKYRIARTSLGGLVAYRHGEEWRDLVGDKLIGAMFDEIEQLRAALAERPPTAWPEPIAWADAIAFESAMKAGKGCDVWPGSPGDYEERTGRKLIGLGRAQPTGQPMATRTGSNAPPRIGRYWPGQGGIYVGLARGEDGKPDYHLIQAEEHGKDLTWEDAKAWAASLQSEGHQDFALPTRNESALLYAHVRDRVVASHWHWTGTRHSVSNAWCQDFLYGSQDLNGKMAEGWALAVRRVAA